MAAGKYHDTYRFQAIDHPAYLVLDIAKRDTKVLLCTGMADTNSLPAFLTVPEHTVKLEILARAPSGAYLISRASEFKGEMKPIKGTLSSGQLAKGLLNVFTGSGKASPDAAPGYHHYMYSRKLPEGPPSLFPS